MAARAGRPNIQNKCKLLAVASTGESEQSSRHPLYCTAFSPASYQLPDGSQVSLLSTCGGRFASLYEVRQSGVSQSAEGEASTKCNATPLSLRQCYRDADDGESYFACAFAGRGFGAPVEGGSSGEDNDRSFVDINADTSIQTRGGKPDNKRRKLILPFSESQTGPPLLCLAGKRGMIKVIDTRRRSLFLTMSGHGNDVNELKPCPSNEWLLLSASKDESIRLWNLHRSVCVAIFSGHHGHKSGVLSIDWHSSGTHFVSGGMDNAIKLWRVKSDAIKTAIERSGEIYPNGWEDGSDKVFDPVSEQFPFYSSTNKVHTNYIGELVAACTYHEHGSLLLTILQTVFNLLEI